MHIYIPLYDNFYKKANMILLPKCLDVFMNFKKYETIVLKK